MKLTEIQQSLQWYAIRSKPNKESSFQRELISRDFEVYYPQLRVNPVNPRSRKWIPYFPGYLFIHVDLQETGTRVLNRIPQSIGLVMFGDYAPVVPEVMLKRIDEKLKLIAQAGGEKYDGLKKGDVVDISSGAFAGYEAIFEERLAGEDRVRVLLKMLSSRYVPVDLNAGAITKRK